MDLKVLLLLTGFLVCAIMIGAGQAEEKKAQESADSQSQAGDDSDMYMEPLEGDPQPSSSDFHQHESGRWYPSFQSSFEPFGPQPSGHSRPVFYNSNQQQEGAYSQRNDPPNQQDVAYNIQPKFNGFNTFAKQYQQEAAPQAVKDKSAALLGDGNFGVIQGGTFYPEKDGYDAENSGFDDFSSFFHNGHGRPSYFYQSNPKPAKQKHQQFENFRDFADINSPPERQYSQYVVVYTNKNGTRTSTTPNEPPQNDPTLPTSDQTEPIRIDAKRPKNILESLALLDQTDEAAASKAAADDDRVLILTKALLLPSYDQGDVVDIPPEKKLSKSKRKLAKLLPEKKHEAKLLLKAKDMMEPLLALS